MNCSQARALLATYRELKSDQADTIVLNEHLEECAACRQFLAQQTSVGEHIRALPSIQPDAEAHTRLMYALAAEHARFMQEHALTVAASPPPAFLKPFLAEHLRKTRQTDPLTALATAHTGPLSITQLPRPRRRHIPNHFAVIGIAAAFLMVIMMGGLTSMLLLTHNSFSGVANITNTNIQNFVQVTRNNYTTKTPYNHVVSAIADRNTIYYTAYGDNNTGWMLEEFDTQTDFSIPLLANESATPLVILGSNQNWLVWLQLDNPRVNHINKHLTTQTRAWSLHALYLNSANQIVTRSTALLNGTFDQATAPGWLKNPVQGVWFAQNDLLVSSIDTKGTSHLWSFQLDPAKKPVQTQIASASDGHILASPTASSDEQNIYWSEEWRTADNTLHSNIWAQHTVQVPPTRGKWVKQNEINKYLLRSDGMSFHPQMVNTTLFFLSTNPAATTDNIAAASTQTATASNTPAATTTVTPQATSPATLPVTTNADPTLVATASDADIQGSLVALSTETNQATELDNTGLDSIPQGGTRFLLWQNSVKGLEMYDAVNKTPVTVKDIAKNANFLTVNNETAVWIDNSDNQNMPTTNANPSVAFSTFNWPTKVSG